MKVTWEELRAAYKDGAKPAEMFVGNILRGGFVYRDKFWFTGSRSVGSVKVELNETLKIHKELNPCKACAMCGEACTGCRCRRCKKCGDNCFSCEHRAEGNGWNVANSN